MNVCSSYIILSHVLHTVLIKYNVALARILMSSNEARLQKLRVRAFASVIEITLDTLDHSCSVALVTVAARCEYSMLATEIRRP